MLIECPAGSLRGPVVCKWYSPSHLSLLLGEDTRYPLSPVPINYCPRGPTLCYCPLAQLAERAKYLRSVKMGVPADWATWQRETHLLLFNKEKERTSTMRKDKQRDLPVNEEVLRGRRVSNCSQRMRMQLWAGDPREQVF